MIAILRKTIRISDVRAPSALCRRDQLVGQPRGQDSEASCAGIDTDGARWADAAMPQFTLSHNIRVSFCLPMLQSAVDIECMMDESTALLRPPATEPSHPCGWTAVR
jgi:hypothetical protein